ncbi:MAG: hypothetical protein HC786_13785 [Richelia sp. CSU_2_1]|nr:hypothetical protein [Microcoleus sp. SU_5_6]NJL66785.1 hypothetical protein [Microcoleus sp. SM1_3_4]NJR23147.1 hypothetical protein [Richelia sp. CSU_2_1]
MTPCPCCSNEMLRHVRRNQVYWFCRECWQEMPVYNLNTYGSLVSIGTLDRSFVQNGKSFSTHIRLSYV